MFIKVPIGKSVYDIPLNGGENAKQYIISLAADLNQRINNIIATSNFRGSDALLLVMATLSVLDELSDTKKKLEETLLSSKPKPDPQRIIQPDLFTTDKEPIYTETEVELIITSILNEIRDEISSIIQSKINVK